MVMTKDPGSKQITGDLFGKDQKHHIHNKSLN